MYKTPYFEGRNKNFHNVLGCNTIEALADQLAYFAKWMTEEYDTDYLTLEDCQKISDEWLRLYEEKRD